MLLLPQWLFNNNLANNRFLIPRAWLSFRPYSRRGLVALPFWGNLAFRFCTSFAYTSPLEIYYPMTISLKVEAFLRKALWYWPYVCFEVTSLLLMILLLPVHRPVACLLMCLNRGLVVLRSWYFSSPVSRPPLISFRQWPEDTQMRLTDCWITLWVPVCECFEPRPV